MSIDLTWLAAEAKTLHAYFQNIFYLLIGLFLVIGVIIEYFKLPLGAMPNFSQLVGRTIVASILLQALPEIMDALSLLSNAIASDLGDLHQMKNVLDRFSEKMSELSLSWISAKDLVIMAISFITFFLLYFSVFLAEAFIVYCWTLIYVVSPITIAFFVLPQTSAAASSMFRALIEVNCWKIMWSILATLLWSTALSDVNKADINFMTVICYNIFLALSVVLTPKIVNALSGGGGGLTGLGTVMAGTGVYAAATGIKTVGRISGQTYNSAVKSANSRLSGTSFQKNYIQKLPLVNTPPPKPIFVSQKSKSNH